jgi:hypothetical protein
MKPMVTGSDAAAGVVERPDFESIYTPDSLRAMGLSRIKALDNGKEVYDGGKGYFVMNPVAVICDEEHLELFANLVKF